MPEPDEIRRDLVVFSPQTRPRFWPQQRLATMVLTSRQIVFLPPERKAASSLVSRVLIAFASPTPLRDRESFQLSQITHLRPLTLEWGATFQIGVDGWSFQLVANESPLEVLDNGARQQHLDAVREAWLAARNASGMG